MTRIRLGVVGVGGIAQGSHLPEVAALRDFELTALCDVDAEKLQRVGEQYGIAESRRFARYQDMIHSEDVDAVDICTPNDAHFDIAMEAVKAGKPFALEKPIAMSWEQAKALDQAVKCTMVMNMVCFSYRFKAAARYARDLVRQGTLGRIHHVDFQYYQAWGLERADAERVWRFSKERAGSGALGDLGSHGLDLVRFVTGLECESVMGYLGTFIDERRLPDGSGMGKVDVDDFSHYFTKLTGGASATHRITRFAYGRNNYQRLEIYGSEGALQYTLDEKGDGRDRLSACTGPQGFENHQFVELPIPEEYRSSQMRSFADLLMGRGDGLAATIADGRINQRVMDAVLLSASTGRWIDVKE